MSAVRWLKHDWQNRDKHKYEVLECIRFGNIAPWQLVDIKRNPENPDFMELAKDLRICKMIDDGLSYVILLTTSNLIRFRVSMSMLFMAFDVMLEPYHFNDWSYRMYLSVLPLVLFYSFKQFYTAFVSFG